MAHLNYYVDLCTDAYIVHNGAVLLRLHEKYNFWMAPGGHIDPGEDVNQAVLREVWEEVGLRVTLIGPSTWIKQDFDINKDLVPPIFVNRHAINEHHDHSSFIFFARSDSREINPQEEASKNTECVWVTKEELDHMKENDPRLRDDVYRYASAALERVT